MFIHSLLFFNKINQPWLNNFATKYQKIKLNLHCYKTKSTDKQKRPILIVGRFGTSAYFLILTFPTLNFLIVFQQTKPYIIKVKRSSIGKMSRLTTFEIKNNEQSANMFRIDLWENRTTAMFQKLLWRPLDFQQQLYERRTHNNFIAFLRNRHYSGVSIALFWIYLFLLTLVLVLKWFSLLWEILTKLLPFSLIFVQT